jgi:hypothetical protein
MEIKPENVTTITETNFYNDNENLSQIVFRMVILTGIAALATLAILLPIKFVPGAVATISSTFYHLASEANTAVAATPYYTSSNKAFTFTWTGEAPSKSYLFVYNKDGFHLISSGKDIISSNSHTLQNGKVLEKTTFILTK